MSQGCSKYQQVHISQALWFLQTKDSVELQSMIIQPNDLCGVPEIDKAGGWGEANGLLVPTVALPEAKLPTTPKSRQGQPSGSHAVSELGCALPLYRQRRGNPSVCILSVHIPKQYRQTHRFQQWFTGLPLPKPVVRLGPWTSVAGWVWARADLWEPGLLFYRRYQQAYLCTENVHRQPGQTHKMNRDYKLF